MMVNWHHICIVQDSTSNIVNLTAYVDGSSSGSSPSSTSAFVETNNRIGDGYYSGFEGNIDEVAVFSSALSGTDIADIYNSGTPTDLTSLNPVAWYRNGDNGTWKSPQWLIPNNENKTKFSNYSFDYDGVDDYLNCGEIPPLFKYFPIGTAKDTTWSASMWVKGSASGGFFEIPYIQVNSSFARSFGFLWGGSYLYFGGKYAQIKIKELGTSAYSTTEWNHIVMTFDGIDHTALSSYTLYVGGTSVSIALITPNIGDFLTENIAIGVVGSDGGNTYYWDGNIDEVSLFDIELTSENVTSIYNSGTPNDISSLSPVGYWRSEQSYFTDNWLVDNSALSNYSTRSFAFDGVDDYISVSDNSIGKTQNISYSIWVNLGVTTRQYIIGNQASSNGGCGLQIESTDVLIFQMADGTNDSFYNSRVASFSTYAPLNTWNHILATWDGTDSKIYINGVLRNTWSPTLPYTISGYWATFNIGWRAAGFQYMTNGKLDELALFNSAISIGDVWDGSGQPIDVSAVSGLTNNWRMGEDATFNTNWNVPDNVGSATGTSANMTISDLEGNAPNYTSGGLSNNMTIEDRVGDAPNSTSNALSLNMDEVDRETDVPT